jgi:hypothetical protein
VLADGVDAVLLLGLFVAAVYSIGDRVLNDVDQKPRRQIKEKAQKVWTI